MPMKMVYTGNLWVDISDIFLDLDGWLPKPRDLEKSALNYGTFYFTRNVLHGAPRTFGVTEFGHGPHKTLADFQDIMKERKSPSLDVALLCEVNPLIDPAAGDFRPKPDASRINGLGARSFVPWGLSAVVGEWNFHPFADDANPVIEGENMNFSKEYFERGQYAEVPSNPLTCRGLTRTDFIKGALENWITDALQFNGKDACCLLEDKEIKRSVNFRSKNPREQIRFKDFMFYDGTKRKSLDMDTNNFLIEAVVSAAQGGGIVSKAASTGYQLSIDDSGKIVLSMRHSGGTYLYFSSQSIADAKWHHFIVEVDRAKVNGVRMYLDGSAIPGDAAGIWPDEKASLANDGDFFVGKSREDRHFKGALDFLRVSRGTLADAHTSIEELYAWEFKGPMMRDFTGKVTGVERSAGAIDGDKKNPNPGQNK